MKIYIADVAKRKGNLYKQIILDFFEFLKKKKIELNNIELEICDDEVIEELKILNCREDRMCEAIYKYFVNLNYLEGKNSDLKNLNQLFLGVDSRDIAIIIIGDFKTNNHWGEAQGICAVIKNDHPKNIWHEIAHIFGAEDHYNEENKLPSSNCKSSNCLMHYGNLDGEFCDTSLIEIESHINK